MIFDYGYMYIQNLRDELLNTLQYYNINFFDMIFLYNYNPKHISGKVREWLGEQEFESMVWCAQSPDLTPLNISEIISKDSS